MLASALAEARKARQHILQEMTSCSPAPRGALAPNAPRIRRFTVDTDKLGMLIGPGGRNIRGIIEESGADEIKVFFQPCLSCRDRDFCIKNLAPMTLRFPACALKKRIPR